MSNPAAPDPRQKMQCRYLKPDGVRCTKAALNGEFYCFHHGRDRRHTRNVRYSPAIIQIPLLDNRAAIQVVLTDLARGLAAGTLDIRISREITHVLRLASLQLTRPALEAPRLAEALASLPAPEPVDEVTLTPEGDELGPELPYHGASGKPEREWSFSEFLYRTVFPQQAGQPLPEEGYIDPAKAPTPLALEGRNDFASATENSASNNKTDHIIPEPIQATADPQSVSRPCRQPASPQPRCRSRHAPLRQAVPAPEDLHCPAPAPLAAHLVLGVDSSRAISKESCGSLRRTSRRPHRTRRQRDL